MAQRISILTLRSPDVEYFCGSVTKNEHRLPGAFGVIFKLPGKRSKMPEMSERLMEVFAVIVTIVLGAVLSEMFIQFFER